MFRLLTLPAVAALVLAAGSAQGASPRLPGLLVYSSDRGPAVHNIEVFALPVIGHGSRDLTNDQSADGGASGSPDGRWIAFWSERLDGDRVVRGLWVMHSDGSGQRRVTPADLAVDGGTPATWSPDSRRLAFTGSVGQTYGVWLVNLDGSGLRLLAENASDPQWAPRDARVAYDHELAVGNVRVETVNVDTGAREVIGAGYSPTWSPDAKSIAFVNLDQKTGATDLFVAPAAGGAPVQLTHVRPGGFVSFPHWSPTGRSIAFTLDGAVHTIAPDGSRMSRLHVGNAPTWSPSGSELAFLVGRGVGVMRADGSHERQLPAKTPVLISDPPAWSHDGTHVLVQTLTDRSEYDLFVSNADGSGLHRLTHTKQDEFLPVWSPTRRRIAFVRGRSNPSIWISDRSGRGARRLTSGTYPSWAPNGRHLAFESEGDVYTITDRGSHAKKRIASGSMPAWSPDGTAIALLHGTSLYVVDLRTGSARDLADLSCGDPSEGGETILQQPAWSPDSTTLALTRTCDRGRYTEGNAWLFDAATGAARDIAFAGGAPSRLAWSPDGSWLAFTTEDPFERIEARQIGGVAVRRISVSAGDDRDLDWR
jgi:Tol biopolymer transport system component